MRYLLAFLLLLALVGSGLQAAAAVAAPLNDHQTLREVAHTHGVRGGDLAEALGLERSVDKGLTLAELGLAPERVAAVLDTLAARSETGSAGQPAPVPTAVPAAGVEQSIRQLAHTHNLNGMVLVQALGLPANVDKDVPVSSLGIDAAQLGDALRHLATGADSDRSALKYWLWPPLLLLGLWWLVRRARQTGRRRYPQAFYLATLVVVVAVFGFALGKSPNPMEGVVKVFKAGAGLYSDLGVKLALLGYFSLLAVLGNKLICGWGCPFGALEELLYSLPLLRRSKRRHLPFVWTNTLRSILFLLFILVLGGWLGGRPGLVIYHYLNPFNLFSGEFALWSVAAAVALFLALSLVVYRPFCQLVCPFGWYSWLLEKFSIFAIRIDRERCNDCGACARTCPLQAAAGRLAGKALPADCFSCGRCLDVCPCEAIDYGRKPRRG